MGPPFLGGPQAQPGSWRMRRAADMAAQCAMDGSFHGVRGKPCLVPFPPFLAVQQLSLFREEPRGPCPGLCPGVCKGRELLACLLGLPGWSLSHPAPGRGPWALSSRPGHHRERPRLGAWMLPHREFCTWFSGPTGLVLPPSLLSRSTSCKSASLS